VDRIKEKSKLVRKYDIPLLAGYSQDGSEIYIDKDMPDGYESRTGGYVYVIPYLVMHEGIEKALIDYLRCDTLLHTLSQCGLTRCCESLWYSG